jgi:hypothetical protein
MSQTIRHQLIGKIEAFCREKGLSDRQFSDIATRNAKFMPRLRANIVSSQTMEKAERFVNDHGDASPEALARMVDEYRDRLVIKRSAPEQAVSP